MLSYGCSSGPICLNYSNYLFPVLSSAICFQLEMRNQDSKFFIQNRFSIAPIHISILTSRIKVNFYYLNLLLYFI